MSKAKETKTIEEFQRSWDRKFFKQNKEGYYVWTNPEPDEIEEFCKEEIKKVLKQD